MPDLNPLEDQATLYVTGGLSENERAAFETVMAGSTELRALVRDLEEGMAALAIAAPRRQPPAKVWGRIEEAVAREISFKSMTQPLESQWWKNGWAAAAACLIGWLLYAVWMSYSAKYNPTAIANSEPAMIYTNGLSVQPRNSSHLPSATSPEVQAQLNSKNEKDLNALRSQVTSLKMQLAQMSQSVAKQQAMLADSSRMKFFQLNPVSGENQEAAMKQLSPALQRALFLGMARQLGWLPDSDGSTTINTIVTGHPTTNQWGVDFVDLHPGGDGNSTTQSTAPATAPPPKTDTQNSIASLPTTVPSTSTSPTPGSFPAFISGENVIVAIDMAIAAKGSYMSFSSGDGQPLGTVVMGSNPAVVTIPLSTSSIATGGLILNITSPTGTFNSIQYMPTAP